MTLGTFGRVSIALLFAFAVLGGDEQNDAGLLDFTVVAVDSQGRQVNDLTSGEFQVTDAGKRQQIAFFRHNDDKLLQPPEPAPNELSNRSGGRASGVTLILFDLLNERFSTRGVAANQLVHDLEGLEAADNLYLYLLTVEGRIFAVRGFAEREGNHQPDGTPWTKRIKPVLDDAMRTVLRTRPADIDVAVRVQLTLNALNAIAAQLSMFPGRKNVVWLTDGVPIALGPRRSDTGDFVDFTPQLRQLSEWFDRSDAAIYPVAQIMIGSPDSLGGGSGVGSRATLDDLAGLTGGRPTGSKDVGAAVRQAMNDVRASYQVGYYPSPRNRDGKFHKLRITCTRKGVRIQARTGYYAWPEPPGARSETAIEAAVSAGFDAAGIGLRGTLTPDKTNVQLVHLALRIDANDIALAQDGDRYLGQLRLALAAYQPDGRAMASPVVPLDLHYTAAERDKALKEGIEFAQDLPLEKGVNRLRFVAFDRGSNAVGSLTLPVGATGQP